MYYIPFWWMVNDYSHISDSHCKMLLLKIIYRESIGLETSTYKNTMDIINARIGVISAPTIRVVQAVSMVQDIVSRASGYLIQIIVSVAIFRKI